MLVRQMSGPAVVATFDCDTCHTTRGVDQRRVVTCRDHGSHTICTVCGDLCYGSSECTEAACPSHQMCCKGCHSPLCATHYSTNSAGSWCILCEMDKQPLIQHREEKVERKVRKKSLKQLKAAAVPTATVAFTCHVCRKSYASLALKFNCITCITQSRVTVIRDVCITCAGHCAEFTHGCLRLVCPFHRSMCSTCYAHRCIDHGGSSTCTRCIRTKSFIPVDMPSG